ncbi:MAG: ABC-2 family transporter protein [Caulobacteraceae bacterium]|nr:ABC-2 family transporter protein [Caulobacteraceae bacterium]
MRSISPPRAPEALRRRAPAWSVVASALQALRMGALGALAGWPVLVGRAIFYLVALAVLSALWGKVASERLAGALPLPAGGLALYVGATEWIMLSIPSIHLRLEDDIRSGALETHLLRPKLYLVLRIAESLGDMLVRLATLGLAALGLLALSGRSAPAEGLACLAASAILGGVIGLLLYTLVGLSGFWVRRTLPAYLVIQKLMFLLGGLFAPVSLYTSAAFRRLSEASPFAAQLYWPSVQLIAPSAAVFARALALQAAWIAVLSLAAAAIWRAGVRKLLRQGI